MTTQEKIKHVTEVFLDDQLDYHKLSNAAKDLKNLLDDLSEEDMDVEAGRDDIHFENGKALGTFWAALCVDDMIRTRQFMRGVNQAAKDKLSKQDAIHIMYAGTGPFATLVLPLLFIYPTTSIRYTFLEVNQFTFDLLQKVISKLGLEEYNIDYVLADASTYEINQTDLPDIIISETMQNALEREQQVPIFLNLMRQAKLDTIFVPESITLSVGLQKSAEPTELPLKNWTKVQQVFEVSKSAMFDEHNAAIESEFEAIETIIQGSMLKNFNQVVLFTEIQVYKDTKINYNESGLTIPLRVMDVEQALKIPITINTQYKISDHPKLEYQIG